MDVCVEVGILSPLAASSSVGALTGACCLLRAVRSVSVGSADIIVGPARSNQSLVGPHTITSTPVQIGLG